MAEAIQRQISILEEAQSALEHGVPLLVTPSRIGEGLGYVIQAAEHLEQVEWDDQFRSLATSMKILSNSGSTLLTTISFQGFIVEVLEHLTELIAEARNSGVPNETNATKLNNIGEFLIGLSARMTVRYKLNVTFEPEYEAKSLRAFMVIKELSGVVRFLNMAPDIADNANPNLDGGFEIDCLSQESPEELHRLAGSVLEVQNVQIFVETRPQAIRALDPPSHADSFDTKIFNFLNK